MLDLINLAIIINKYNRTKLLEPKIIRNFYMWCIYSFLIWFLQAFLCYGQHYVFLSLVYSFDYGFTWYLKKVALHINGSLSPEYTHMYNTIYICFRLLYFIMFLTTLVLYLLYLTEYIHCCYDGVYMRIFYSSLVLLSLINIYACMIICTCLLIFDFKISKERESKYISIVSNNQICIDGMINTFTDVECIICLCNINDGDRILHIECKHYNYHAKCILQWLKHNPVCPLCRSNIDLK